MQEERTQVSQLMTSGVLTVAADAKIRDAAATLLEEGVGSLVVVDENDSPVGMFTTTDLTGFVSADESGGETAVSEYMTDQVVTVGIDESLSGAAAKMIRHDVHHLPVTDADGEVVGMLSTMDLTAHFSYVGGTDMI